MHAAAPIGSGGRPLTEALDSMNNHPGYTPRAVGFSRVFVAGFAVAALCTGIAGVTLGEGGYFWGGVGFLVAGVTGLLISIARDGNAPAQSAKDIVDVYFDE